MKWRYASLGLKWRVFMLVLAALLPALALIVRTALAEARRAEAQRLQDVLAIAALAAGRVDTLVRNTRQVLSVMALLHALRGDDAAAANRLLSNLHREHPQYELFAVAHADGSLYASGIEISPDATAAGRVWFHRALDADTFAGGGFQIGRQTGRPTLNFGYPIREAHGGARRVVFAALSLEWVQQEVEQLPVRPEAVLTILDDDGTVIARNRDREAWLGKSYPAWQPVPSGTGAGAPIGHAAERPDAGVLYAHATAGGSGWTYHALVEIPRGAVVAPPIADMRRNLALLSLVALTALGIAWRGGDLLVTRPLSDLVRGTGHLSRGELDARVPVHPGGAPEIRTLAAAFNAMAGSVERRVVERTEELRKARDMADAASRAKSAFLANMSHELRTPLNAVIGFAEVLDAGHFGALNAKQGEYIRDIHASGRHLLSLINDVLDLAKVESGHFDPLWRRIPVAELIGSCPVLIREKCARHGITLELDTDRVKTVDVVADERSLKQILYNLLSNAAKFTPDGGRINVSAALITRPSGPAAKVDMPAIEIVVADTGIGIAPADQARLFENFFQVRSGLQDKSPGTGLGLPLVRRLVAAHGGSIYVESEGEGCGSRFVVVLPLDARRAQTGHSAEDQARHEGRAKVET